MRVKLKLSTAYHAQTDGQAEIVNQHIINCLQPFINHHQDDWADLLSLIDFAAAALSSKITDVFSFLIDCGYESHTSFDWEPINRKLSWDEQISHEQAQRNVKKMKEIWRVIKQLIEHARQIQKDYADNHQQEVNFWIGDNVWLSLKNYKSDHPNKKLDSQMADPFP